MASGGKGKHHYIPVSYSKNFTAPDGFLEICAKSSGGTTFRQKPEAFGYRKRYHAFRREDGSWDTDSIEDLFQGVETGWTPFINSLRASENECLGLEECAHYIALLRVRPPAMRDFIEWHLKMTVEHHSEMMEAAGLFPPRPKELEGIDIVATIDPQKSLEHGRDVLDRTLLFMGGPNLRVLRNLSSVKFVSSDNPIVIYDRSVPKAAIRPYDIHPGRKGVSPIFMVPLDRDHLLMGDFIGPKWMDSGCVPLICVKNKKFVMEVNRDIARFSYHAFFGAQLDVLKSLCFVGNFSPVIDFDVLDLGGKSLQLTRFKFGEIQKLPKFNPVD